MARERSARFRWQTRIADSLREQYGDGHISYSMPWDWGDWFRWFADDEMYERAGMRFITKYGVTLLIKRAKQI